MLADADDHVRRLLVTVGPLAWGLVVSDVAARQSPARGQWCVPTPSGTGRVDMNRFAELIRAHVPETCVLVARSEADLALLRSLETA